jgi:acetyltransferase-like isoleucine patch superfamily enzyme
MLSDEIDLPDDLRRLWGDLKRLRDALRSHTIERYRRVNPFVEDLFDWKDKGRLVTGKDVTIYDSTTIVGDVTIGDRTWIGPFCSLDGSGGLDIGGNCSISAACHIQTHDTTKWALSGGHAAYEYAPVRIADNCFLGAGAIVTRGVTIGHRSLIGAGAVVTNNIDPYTIAAGVPARPIGQVIVTGDGAIDLVYFGS